MPDGQVVFEISGDNRKVQDALRDTTDAIERETRKWDRVAGASSDAMRDKFTGAFKAISAAAVAAKVGQALLDFGKDAIQAASDLEEVQNVVDVTFGDGAAKIESWAKAAGAQFGLTETQAKRFTSTLGAMMKSAGLAGTEIVSMSTDLAGLAADMASFYNLDFDEAFQKIRSGISGETEPLKQLGINMSTVNLEAFAMTQGITKAFDQMSQGEQIMLRYQYLMQATADAQGDFARTSDGYANSVRKFETNLENLKATMGKPLLDAAGAAIGAINGIIEAMTAKPESTVLDEFAAIDLKTGEKLADIQATADQAKALIGVLEELGGKEISSTSLTDFVGKLSGSLGGLNTAMTRAKNGDYAGTISAIAEAMAKNTGTSANQWETLLKAVSDNLPGAVDATLDDKGQTAAFLTAAAAAADDLGGEYPALWKQMLGILGSDAGAAISALAGGATAAAALKGLANGANTLKSDVDAEKWEALLGALSEHGSISLTGAGKSIEEFAEALNGTDPGTDRAKAWQELLGALSADVEGLSKLTGTSAEETSEWLAKLAEGANTLDPSSAEGWDKLFGQLVTGLPGLSDTSAAGLLTELAGGADDAEGYLRALGYSTDDIADAQATWLEVCRKLVQTIPGLSSVINTETGEVNGGVDAIDEYVTAWVDGERKLALWKAHFAKGDALNKIRDQEYAAELDKMTAEQRVKQNREKMDAILKKYGFGEGETPYEITIPMANARGISNEDFEAYNNLAREGAALESAAADAAAEYQRQVDANAEAVKAYADEEAALTEQYGENAVAAGEAAAATEELAYSQDEVSEALKRTTDALKAVEDYYNKVRESSYSGLKSVASGFESIETPAQKARRTMSDLTQQIDELNAAGKDSSGLTKTFQEAEASIPSVQNMTKALESQLQYLNEYNDLIAKARERGVSDTVLASLADGSMESYDYLSALTQGSDEEIQNLNDRYQEVEKARQSLADTLTDTQLAADTEFQSLVDAAQAAAEDLDQYSTAESAMENTVQGIADGIAAKVSAVQAEVDALNAVLGNLGNVGGLVGGLFGGGFHLDGSHATGLDYVPFDNYLAQLHEGESILTAEEARVWRQFKNGGAAVRNTIDYGALHGAIWDGAPRMGGDVYLDGRTVGRVISDQQGNSLRALERSGWQR